MMVGEYVSSSLLVISLTVVDCLFVSATGFPSKRHPKKTVSYYGE